MPALPLTILVSRWVVRSYRSPAGLGNAVLVVVAVSFVHTIAWVGLSASAEAAEARFSLIVRQGTNSPHARAHGAGSLAGYYREAGRLQESLKAFEEASEYAPENARFHVGRAYVLRLMGDAASAEAALKRAMVVTPDRLEAMINLGKLYMETGRLADARTVLARAVNRNGRSTLAIHSLGMVSYRSGDYETAVDLFRRTILLELSNVTYRVDLGAALQFRGELAEAEGVLREALEMEPGNLRARMNLGAVSFEREDYEAAAAAFRGVIAQDSSWSDAHLNLGLTFKAMGEATQARKHLKKALQLSPGDTEADQIRDLLDDM